MMFLRVLIAFAVLMIISIALQFVTVPFSAIHNTFAMQESIERCIRGLIVGSLIWAPIRLVKGDQKAPEISRFLFYVAVAYLIGRAIYDVVAV